MAQRRSFNLPDDHLRHVINTKKCIYDGVVMQKDDGSNECSYRNNLIYATETGDTITGASIHFKSIKHPHFVYHSFALVCTHQRHQNYILQIEIDPPDQISHREPELVIYGAHCVTLNYTESLDDNVKWDWYNWLAEFEKRANLTIYGAKTMPFDGELF